MQIDARAASLAVRARGEAAAPPGDARCKRCGMRLAEGYGHLHCPDCLMYMAIAGQPPAEPEAPEPSPEGGAASVDAVRSHFAWTRTRLALPRSGRQCGMCDAELPPEHAYPWDLCPWDMASRAEGA